MNVKYTYIYSSVNDGFCKHYECSHATMRPIHIILLYGFDMLITAYEIVISFMDMSVSIVYAQI